MRALLTGAGNMGRAIGAALTARGDTVAAMVGRSGRPDPSTLGPVDVAFEFSHAATFVDNLRYAAAAGARNVVVGTTGWTGNPATVAAVDAVIAEHGLRVVVGPTFSIGVVLFTEVAEEAAKRFGRFPEFDAYVFEQHRRTKADRPSGTASAIADRMLPHLASKRRAHLPEGEAAPDPDTLEVVALRIGAHPGMHVVGFEAPGESIELRVTARDRSAYVAGAILAADRFLDDPTWPAGRSSFVDLVRGITSGTTD